MHEIVTLQLGQRANYLATHFWNTQESYFTYDDTQALSPVDHDVHFRPGIGPRGEDTFTPRTLIYDLKGGFGGLGKWGGLYDQQQLDDGQGLERAKGVWNGRVVLQADPRISQSDYQKNLDEGVSDPQSLSTETVRYWADFNRVFYHPRSINQLNDYELSSTLMPFERWENGEELFTSIDRDTDLIDRDVRPWAEECDQMQGIQVFTGGDDAWGGFASRYVERLRDEYGKSPIWVWGMEEEHGKGQRAKQLLKTVNTAKTIYEMSSHASLYVPLSLPAGRLPEYVSLNRDSRWHVSALISMAVESMTLPSRLRPDSQKRGFLGDIEAALNVNGNQRIAELQCSILPSDPDSFNIVSHRARKDDRLPSNIDRTMVEEDELYASASYLDMNLSTGGACSPLSLAGQRGASDHTFGGVNCMRGRVEVLNEEDADQHAITDTRRRRRFTGLPITERYYSSIMFPLLDSFPMIVTLSPNLAAVAVHTSLSTTTRISSRIKALQKVVSRTAGVDERETLSNGLGDIGEAYEEEWANASGEDTDD